MPVSRIRCYISTGLVWQQITSWCLCKSSNIFPGKSLCYQKSWPLSGLFHIIYFISILDLGGGESYFKVGWGVLKWNTVHALSLPAADIAYTNCLREIQISQTSSCQDFSVEQAAVFLQGFIDVWNLCHFVSVLLHSTLALTMQANTVNQMHRSQTHCNKINVWVYIIICNTFYYNRRTNTKTKVLRM